MVKKTKKKLKKFSENFSKAQKLKFK
jgi:hypothetical protein